MNKIIEHQNDQTILDKLSAQRNLYSLAKRWRNLRFIVCVLSIIILSVLKVAFHGNETIPIILALAVFVSLLLGPIFNKQLNTNRTLASRIRQLLDTELFGFLWDESLWGEKPSAEDIYDHKSSPIPAKLYDWYDTGIGDVQDVNVAILLCQRENMRYDSHIRTRFTKLCEVIAWIACIGIIITAAIFNYPDWLSIIVFGLIPITPIVRWIQAVRNEDGRDKEARDSLEALIKKEMENALKRKAVHITELKRIQNLMYAHRRAGYLVPDWFYCVCRKKSEDRAAYSVQEFLKLYNQGQ